MRGVEAAVYVSGHTGNTYVTTTVSYIKYLKGIGVSYSFLGLVPMQAFRYWP